MKSLQLFSEPFARTGSMAAEGFRRLLGRPSLDLLQTFVRESVQNVVDAGKGEVGPRVLIRLRTLDVSQTRALRERVLNEIPMEDGTKGAMETALTKERIPVLEICDFNTEGLSGPTRADEAHDSAESLNFVNFLRNVGAGRDTAQGGGTYGYGKSSLYAMSSCATIVVDSLTTDRGRSERRLMACHLGAAYDARDSAQSRRRYTGRHWWGVLDGLDSVEPATDSLATEIADALSLPARAGDRTGTSILIVDPFIPDGDFNAAINEVVETLLWNFWPRMTATTPKRERIVVDVECEGRPVPVPRPEDFPPLDIFSEAMADLRKGSSDCISIRCQRPIKELGKLIIRKGMRGERVGPAAEEGSVVPRQCSHIALMRPVQLVVKYLQGEAFSDSRFEWAGVFVCSDDDEVEGAFADSEPPAHDDWVPDNLPKGRGKTFVKVGLARITDVARSFAPSGNRVGGDISGPSQSLAATATRMGALLGDVGSKGPGRRKVVSSKPNGKKRALAVSRVVAEGLRLMEDGTVAAVFSAELRNDGSNADLHVFVEPSYVVEGGNTGSDDLPPSMSLRVLQVSLNEKIRSAGNLLHVGKEGGNLEILVPVVEGAAVSARVRLLERGGES
jgi:hypothetical protein